MTREEHIDELEEYLKGNRIFMYSNSSRYWKKHYKEVIDALKQKPVLDKVESRKIEITDECLCERMKYRQGDPLYIPNSKGNYNYFYIKYCPICGKLLPKGL